MKNLHCNIWLNHFRKQEGYKVFLQASVFYEMILHNYMYIYWLHSKIRILNFFHKELKEKSQNIEEAQMY